MINNKLNLLFALLNSSNLINGLMENAIKLLLRIKIILFRLNASVPKLQQQL